MTQDPIRKFSVMREVGGEEVQSFIQEIWGSLGETDLAEAIWQELEKANSQLPAGARATLDDLIKKSANAPYEATPEGGQIAISGAIAIYIAKSAGGALAAEMAKSIWKDVIWPRLKDKLGNRYKGGV